MLAERAVVRGWVSVPLEMVVQTCLAVECLAAQLTAPLPPVRAGAENSSEF